MSAGPISKAKRLRVFMRDGFRCQFCGEDELDWLRVDHIIPREKGGSNDETNLWTLCLWCNSLKRTKEVPFQIRLPSGQCGTCGQTGWKCDRVHPDSPTYQRMLRDAERRASVG